MSNETYSAYYHHTLTDPTAANMAVTVTSPGMIDIPSGNAVNAYGMFNHGSVTADTGVSLPVGGGHGAGGAAANTTGLYDTGTLQNYGTLSAAQTPDIPVGLSPDITSNQNMISLPIEITMPIIGSGGYYQSGGGTYWTAPDVDSASGAGAYLADGGSVANGAGTLIEGSYNGVLVEGAAGTVTNDGTIQSAGVAAGYYGLYGGDGVFLADGGAVANDTGALIEGGNYGVYIEYAAGTVTNDGTILGGATYGTGVYLQYGGSVVNDAKALIEGGSYGVYIEYAAGAVTNDGTIAGGAYGVGVDIQYDGSVINGAKALIEGGYYGVYLGYGAGTITNYGTIEGGYYSVVLSSSDVLTVEAGSRLIGAAEGYGGTLELGGGAGAGTLSGLGSQYTGFGLYLVASGADWTLKGTNTVASYATLIDQGTLTVTGTLVDAGTITVAAGADFKGTVDFSGDAGVLALADPAGVTVEGFAQGDTIDLTGVSYSSADSVSHSGGILTIEQNGTVVADLALTGVGSGATFELASDGHGGIEIFLPGSGSNQGANSGNGNDTLQVYGILTAAPGGAAGTTVLSNPISTAVSDIPFGGPESSTVIDTGPFQFVGGPVGSSAVGILGSETVTGGSSVDSSGDSSIGSASLALTAGHNHL